VRFHVEIALAYRLNLWLELLEDLAWAAWVPFYFQHLRLRVGVVFMDVATLLQGATSALIPIESKKVVGIGL